MKRVLVLGTGIFDIPPRGYGATERVIYEFSKALSESGCKVTLIDFYSNRETNQIPLDLNKNFEIYKFKKPLHMNKLSGYTYVINGLFFLWTIVANLPSVMKILSSKQIRYVNIHTPYLFPIFYLISRLADRKVIFSLHNPAWMGPYVRSLPDLLGAKVFDMLALKYSDLATFESKIIQKNLVRLLGDSLESKSLIVYKGVTITDFDESLYTPGSNKQIILHPARIAPQKNQLSVVKALALLKGKYPDIVLFLVGPVEDKDYYNSVLECVEKQGLNDNIVRLGSVNIDALRKIYAQGEIALNITVFTGFDVILGELLAAQRAIVASNIGPNLEILQNGFNARLVDPHDPNQIAQAIEELLVDDKTRLNLRKGAFYTSRNVLSWRIIARRFMDFVANSDANHESLKIE